MIVASQVPRIRCRGFQRDRVHLAQSQDTPRFVSMRRDERAVADRYNDQDPAAVAAQITQEARLFADSLREPDDDGWLRMGTYPWPSPEVRTVEWVGRRTAHELAHHLFDERRLLNAAGKQVRLASSEEPCRHDKISRLACAQNRQTGH